MAVRSGEIDGWDAIDDLQTLAPDYGPASKTEAEELLTAVKHLTEAGIAPDRLTIAKQAIRIRVVEEERDAVVAAIAGLGLRNVSVYVPTA